MALTKNIHDKITVWIKIFYLPLDAWCGENLCLIGSKIGISLAFDSYTEEMCIEQKGRNAYARILVKMVVAKVWKDKIEVGTFFLDKPTSQFFDIKYAWWFPCFFMCWTVICFVRVSCDWVRKCGKEVRCDWV